MKVGSIVASVVLGLAAPAAAAPQLFAPLPDGRLLAGVRRRDDRGALGLRRLVRPRRSRPARCASPSGPAARAHRRHGRRDRALRAHEPRVRARAACRGDAASRRGIGEAAAARALRPDRGEPDLVSAVSCVSTSAASRRRSSTPRASTCPWPQDGLFFPAPRAHPPALPDPGRVHRGPGRLVDRARLLGQLRAALHLRRLRRGRASTPPPARPCSCCGARGPTPRGPTGPGATRWSPLVFVLFCLGARRQHADREAAGVVASASSSSPGPPGLCVVAPLGRSGRPR